MEKVFAARLSEVPEWGKKVVQVGGEKVILIKTKGVVYALENECPHQGAPFDAAFIKEAGRIACPRHGYRFDLTSGACEGHPEFTLRLYPVEIRGDEIYLEI